MIKHTAYAAQHAQHNLDLATMRRTEESVQSGCKGRSCKKQESRIRSDHSGGLCGARLGDIHHVTETLFERILLAV